MNDNPNENTELKLQKLREAAQLGLDAIENGHFKTITPETLDQFMESVSAKLMAKNRQANHLKISKIIANTSKNNKYKI